MKKIVLLFIFLMLVGCGNNVEDVEKEKQEENEVEEVEKTEEENIIDLGGLTVYVPSTHQGTGGYEGYRYVNAIVKPLNNENYEIEVPTGYAHIGDNFEQIMSVRNHYTGATIIPIDTEGWRAPVQAYTYVRNGDDFSSFTKFQEEHGSSLIIGLFYPTPFSESSNAYTEIEMRVFAEDSNDYYEIFENFVANYIDWEIPDIPTD